MASRVTRSARLTWLSLPALAHIVIAAILGALGAYVAGRFISWIFAPLAFWDVTALVTMGALWLSLRSLDAKDTKKHATREDPGQGFVIVFMLLASVASIAGVLVLIMKGTHAQGGMQAAEVAFGIVSIVISWLSVHVLYMLRYADLYYAEGGAIDFNTTAEPTYQDFAYVAFTIGMTYQVSDTSFKTSALRKTARQHALLSYLFGTAIIATVINAVAGLGK